MSSQLGERPSSRNQVREAIHSLHEAEIDVTVESLVRVTGLKTVTVNDCIKDLKERDEIWSVERGVYRPRIRHPESRVVSTTMLPSGMVKLEVGDIVLDLTPREVHILAPFFAGINMQVAASAHNHMVMALGERLAKSERRVKALEMVSRDDQPQLVFEDVEAKEDPRQLRMEV